MKFMITCQFRPGKLHDGLSQFSQMTPEQDQADHGSAVKLIGRWHDLAGGRGVVICESDKCRGRGELGTQLEQHPRCRRCPRLG